jgi:hypothetical protein
LGAIIQPLSIGNMLTRTYYQVTWIRPNNTGIHYNLLLEFGLTDRNFSVIAQLFGCESTASSFVYVLTRIAAILMAWSVLTTLYGANIPV